MKPLFLNKYKVQGLMNVWTVAPFILLITVLMDEHKQNPIDITRRI